MDQVEEIKQKVDIVSLIGERVKLKKAGRNFKGLCPFHDEKTPSFIVSPEMQIFKCFGCGQGGDAIKFLQLYEKMEFWEALEFLAEKTGVELERKYSSSDEKLKKKLFEINRLTAEFYHFLLTKHDLGEVGRDYLKKRKINSESIEKFKLGFAPKKDNVLVSFLKKKGFSQKDAVQAGLVISRYSKYFDRFRGRLIFPLYDYRGRPIGFSGRTILGYSDSKMAKYINTPETKIYHKSNNLYGLWQTKSVMREEKEVFVVEGETDVISACQNGLQNVVAVKGTAFTYGQAGLLKRFVNLVILAMDSDQAGVEAMKRSVQILDSTGLDVKVALLPDQFHDLDEIARNKPKLLKKLSKKSIPVWDFIIETTFSKYPGQDSLVKKKILSEVLPFLIDISNEVLKDYYLQKLAGKLGVSVESVLAEAEKMEDQSLKKYKAEIPEKKVEEDKTKRQRLEEYLIGLILIREDWGWLDDDEVISLFRTPLVEKIIKVLGSFLQRDKAFNLKKFVDSLPKEVKSGFQSLYLSHQVQDDDRTKVAFLVNQLRKEDLQTRLKTLTEEIERSEAGGCDVEVDKLEKEFVQISRKLLKLN